MDYALLIPVAVILYGCWINHRYPLTEEEQERWRLPPPPNPFGADEYEHEAEDEEFQPP